MDTNVGISVITETHEIGDIGDIHLYTLQQLKAIAKGIHVKVGGTKKDVYTRIKEFHTLHTCAGLLVRVFRRFIYRKLKTLRGPALFQRTLCNNPSDFLSGECISTISPERFVSFTDEDGFIYGFDISSGYNLIMRVQAWQSIRNPYNRNIIPVAAVQAIRDIVRLSSIIGYPLVVELDDPLTSVSVLKKRELRIVGLFIDIDGLGNYSSPSWMDTLNRVSLLKFIRELADIWNYRSQISAFTKSQICPPNGNPFNNRILLFQQHDACLIALWHTALSICEDLVKTGLDKDSRSLGAYYVLGALTIVSPQAAIALPWLYESFH